MNASEHNRLPHLPDPIAVVRAIGREAMLARLEHARTRSFAVAASRPVPRLNEEAFDTAVGAFHRAYQHAYRPALASEAQHAHDEATREALGAFLGAYEEMRR